ncbi:hypothetical protein SAMN04488519_103181 [Algoriphagus ornithinivorans]|uniref:Uncharacterized protein n=1 Tax=Algoriphagus ornithinivorans TaxID=226506 RepID=A0A1I5DWQ8_9BACT|nr:DUF6090 family protein [Algoriphagus ornithinivorans]SFO03672.1 hypothetical protein SAMN04488519_103181 [Algoriphagus ornithinivorans]
MIPYFRKIRQKLLKENRVTRYLAYAIGEIVLVVIGILIALAINNWNEANKNKKREKAFLTNLLEDLKADSLSLQEISATLQNAVRYKLVFSNHIEGKPANRDSINANFLNQYNILVDFIPNSNTLDELTYGNGLSLISNAELRRKIVSIYNTYDDLTRKLKIGQEKGQLVVNYVSLKVKNINEPTEEEINQLLKDPFYVNQTLMNYLVTQMDAVIAAQEFCNETLLLIRNELDHD